MTFEYENSLILVEKKNDIAFVTLNNPPMNLNSSASMKELSEDFHKLEKDPDVRVIILTGSGTRAFNAGSDIKEMKTMAGDYRGQKFYMEMDMMDRIEYICKPTICAIEGFCLGGGLELACCCDIRIASENSRFGSPEITLGLYPAAGGVYRLPRLIGPSRALEMMYTGEQIDSQTALEYGLINHITPPGSTIDASIELAEKILKMPSSSLRIIKELTRKTWQKESKDNHQTNLEYIDLIFDHPNGQEGMSAFIEKRKPNFNYSL